jgi:hypothetical protein
MGWVSMWLDIASKVSAIVIAVAALLALRQIALAKRQLETTKDLFKLQSRRASIELSIDACKRYAENVIQDFIKIIKHCETNDILFFENATFRRNGDSIQISTVHAKKEDAAKLAEIGDLLTSFCNGLEAFAIYFLSGVADEEIAYRTNALSYTEMCETAYKVFAITGKTGKNIDAINTLYFRWAKRLENDDLVEQKLKINQQLSTFAQKPIRPIGT